MARFFILILLFPVVCSAQISEDFNDGNFTTSPIWMGTTEKFTVNENLILQLTAPAEESEAWLFTESSAIEQARWRVRVVMGFNPSSNNLARIYLAADAASPAEMKNALYVEVGNTSDDVSLYSLSSTNTTKLIDGPDDRVDITAVDITIEVTREGDLWTLRSNTGTGFQTEGTADYSPKFSSLFLGLFCKYTSTRSSKFWFDDIDVTGEPYSDTYPPQLMDFQVVNGEKINLSFSEPIDTAFLSATNFTLETLQRTPSSVTIPDGSSTTNVELWFNPALDNVLDEKLTLSGIKDLYGNGMKDTSITFSYERISVISAKVKSPNTVEVRFSKSMDESSIEDGIVQITPGEFIPQPSLSEPDMVTLTFDNPLTEGVEYLLTLSNFKDVTGDTILSTHLPLLFYNPKRYDVVFSEIMTDPTPSVGLPESEFVEIYNRTGYPINTVGWMLMVNGKAMLLPDYVLNPNKEVTLIPESAEEDWVSIPNRLPLPTWHSLTNSSGELILLSESGKVIDAIKYSLDKWSDGSFKQDGGWSFELIDVNNLSYTPNGWAYSVEPTGGTPGSENSVKADLPDETPPETEMITYEDSDQIKLWFTESMDMFTDNLISHFKMKSGTATISEVLADTVFADNCFLIFSEKLKINMVHEFSDISLTDNTGNEVTLNSNQYFGRPDTISQNEKEIVINEILFNPRPDGYDFIEIFNKSQKILNLGELSFAECEDDGTITKLFPLMTESVLIFPAEYHVFTLSPQNIGDEYECHNSYHLHKMDKFPSMPDDMGTVTLSLSNGTVIDRFHYDESMHFPLLNSTEGVSLERISPESATDNPDNWHSASADCGYATPTEMNSQYSNLQKPEANSFTTENELFTPNSDGYTDKLIINYSFKNPGTVADITIFNAKGNPVKELTNNKLLGTTGFITWDGTFDDGKLAKPGIYIILIKTYNSSGETATSKMTCVVGMGKIVR